MKVRVRDFQSIADQELELVGFTAITGRSNLGKSALLRAVRGAILGMPGDHFIRRKRPACRVEVEGEDFRVAWQKVRKKKKPGLETRLEVETSEEGRQEFSRFGREHPELTAPLGFRVVKAGGLDLTPQFAGQHDALFLLDGASPNAAAEVFKVLGRADVVTEAQAACRSDARKASQEEDVRRGDVRVAGESHAALDWVPGMEDAWFGEGTTEVESLLEGRQLRLAGAVLARELEGLAPVPVPEIPDFTDAVLALQFGDLARAARELAGIAVTEVPGDVLRLPEVTGTEVLDLARQLAALGGPFEPPPTPELGPPPEAALRVAEELLALEEDAGVNLRTLGSLDRELEGIQRELDAFPACPTCEREF